MNNPNTPSTNQEKPANASVWAEVGDNMQNGPESMAATPEQTQPVGEENERLKTEVLNLTPHALNLCDNDGNILREISSSGIARAKSTEVVTGYDEIDGVQVPRVRMEYGEPTDLPEPKEGVILVVSAITANAAKASGRTTDDLRLTAQPVRDEGGRIIGCKALAEISDEDKEQDAGRERLREERIKKIIGELMEAHDIFVYGNGDNYEAEKIYRDAVIDYYKNVRNLLASPMEPWPNVPNRPRND